MLAISITRLLRLIPKGSARQFAVAPGVLDPAVGKRGEVGVLAEDVLGRYELRELHQETLLAHVRVQRVIGLHLVKLRGRDVRLAQRRHPQVGERVAERLAAEAAVHHVSSIESAGISAGVNHGLHRADRELMHDRPHARRGPSRRAQDCGGQTCFKSSFPTALPAYDSTSNDNIRAQAPGTCPDLKLRGRTCAGAHLT